MASFDLHLLLMTVIFFPFCFCPSVFSYNCIPLSDDLMFIYHPLCVPTIVLVLVLHWRDGMLAIYFSSILPSSSLVWMSLYSVESSGTAYLYSILSFSIFELIFSSLHTKSMFIPSFIKLPENDVLLLSSFE